ncbi:response regulator transcription factor [Paenibacillus sp. CMAA1364]
MLNILLVDDEEFVLDYLTDNIDQSTFGIDRIYRASSVDDALRILEETRLHLIITDIRMPEKSGIDLLAHIRSQQQDIKVIMLSGYSDFDYAKEAIRHGAFDYLLKPASPEEINSSIHRAFEAIHKEGHHENQLSLAKRAIAMNHDIQKERLLLDFLLGRKFTTSSLKDRMTALGMPDLSNTRTKLAILRLESENSNDTQEDIELLSYALLNMTEEILLDGNSAGSSLWYCRDPHQYVVILLTESMWEDEEWLRNKFMVLQQQVDVYLHRNVSILISTPQPFTMQMDHLYRESLKHFWNTIGFHVRALQFMDDSAHTVDYQPLQQLYKPPSLLNLMQSGQWQEVETKLDHIFEELDTTSFRTQDHLLEVYYYICNAFSYISHKQGIRLADLVEKPEYLRNGYYFRTATQLKNWTLSLIVQFQGNIEDSPTKGHSHIIRQVHAYISQNLNSDVTLNTISNHVYLHPVYLSRLYKKETGISLSAYISRVRMEKAMYLLTHTNKKILEISKEIGYNKPQYFISLFKEQYLLTPKEFRDSQSEYMELDPDDEL